MNKINQFIDLCLIDEYATKNHKRGFELDIDSIPKNEIISLLELLMNDDNDIRDYVLNSLQNKIDERLVEREQITRWNDGFQSSIDNQTGEVFINSRMAI